MKSFKLSSVVALLVLALMLTACASTPSEGDVESSGSEQSELPSSSVKPSESDKPDSQLPSQSEDETEPLEDGWTRLTEDELKWFNEQFFNVADNVITNAFLNCIYTDVKDIGLEELFYDVPSSEISDDEMALLRGSKIDFDTEFQKVTASYMDEILRTYANITLAESNKVDLDMFLYFGKYDAYYSGHGDVHHSQVEVKNGAKDANGNVTLQCLRVEDQKEYTVTLKAHKNGYYFVSNVLTNEPIDKPVEMNGTALKEDELKWFNEQFFNVENNKIVNYFLNNMFGSVETISINYLFENEPLPEIEITDAEKSALAKTPIDMELDIHKIPVEYMNTILKTYANITLEETRKVGEDDLIYLKEYAAYYVATGDYTYTTYTMESGQRYEDGTIKLQYQHEIEYARCEVTLKPHDNGYYFVSNLIIR